jgi:hypothetical protein
MLERPINEHRIERAPVAREMVEAGAVSGLVGGVAMVVFATIYAAAAGLGFWTPVEAIAQTVLGRGMTGASAIVVGVAIHVAVSMLFGIVFAIVTPRDVAPAPAVAFGMFGGLAILVMMDLIVLPVVNPAVRSQLIWGSSPHALPVGVAFAMHLIYGLGLSLAPSLRRRFNVQVKRGANEARTGPALRTRALRGGPWRRG